MSEKKYLTYNKSQNENISTLLLESAELLIESANDAMFYDKDKDYSNDDIASQISINYEGECNAITGYYKLLPFFRSVGDLDAVDKIKEIISDEKNHQEILKNLQLKYDKIKANES